MNLQIDQYLIDGCMRCPLGATPECKINNWVEELKYLRSIVLDSELTEERKWGVPCYTYNGANVIMISALKDHAVLSFMKGVLLNDSQGILQKPGPNSQSDRILRFTSVDQIISLEETIKSYIQQSVENEKQGLKVEFKKNPEPIPQELETKFNEDPSFKAAFEALTPGRQRGYILHFSQAKQSATRTSRIEKCLPKIMEGKGMQDR